MKKIVFVISFVLLGSFMVNAQKIVLKSGGIEDLKDEKFFNIQYDYSNMSVGKFDKEEDYLNKKVQEYNEKEPGRGDKWKESWLGDRKGRFDVKFEELLNKYLKQADVYVGKVNKDAKYTMILHTTFTEPGFNVYVTRKPALIDVELKIVETANPEKIVALIISKGNTGTAMGLNDMDTGVRIMESYAKCGKELGKYLLKMVWK